MIYIIKYFRFAFRALFDKEIKIFTEELRELMEFLDNIFVHKIISARLTFHYFFLFNEKFLLESIKLGLNHFQRCIYLIIEIN